MVDVLYLIGKDILFGSLTIIMNFLKILIPLMIIVEILITYKVIERMSNKLQFLSNVLRIQTQSIFPLLIGLFMGITYGAGTLIEINDRTPIPKKDFILIGVFLFICHSLIETTMIFAVAGANVWVISFGRLFLALVITLIASRIPLIDKIGREKVDL
jgi:hypothetical protein